MDRKLIIAGAGIVGFLFVFYLIVFTQSGLENSSNSLSSKDVELRYSSWQPFTSERDHFSAAFPTLPQEASHAIHVPGTEDKAVLNMFVSESPNGTIVSVRVVTYPKGEKNPEDIMKQTMEGMMAANEESVLRDIREDDFRGHTALEFAIQNPDVHILGQSFFKEDTEYTLIYLSRLDQFDEEIFKHFVKTFKLLD